MPVFSHLLKFKKSHHSHLGLFTEPLRGGEAWVFVFCEALSQGLRMTGQVAHYTTVGGTLHIEIIVDLYVH